MADYGINRRFMRDKVTLQVLRGFNPTEPGKLSFLAAPLDIVTPAGAAIAGRVAIKSGMAVVVESDTDAYVGGVAASGFRNAVALDADGLKTIYIALADADAHDVQQSGKLVGLDCSDTYEVQTGYFISADGPYLLDDPITVGAGGQFTKAVEGDQIVAHISAVGPNADGSFPYVGLTPGAVGTNVIQFKTRQAGVVVPAGA